MTRGRVMYNRLDLKRMKDRKYNEKMKKKKKSYWRKKVNNIL